MPGSWVAVTGATGFIGRVLLKSLIGMGWKIKALTRYPQPNDKAVRWIEGDLDNLDALRYLVNDAFAVIHCAGQVRGSSLQEFIHTNVTGTRNLVQSLEQEPPSRFLFISSLAARQPELSWYSGSKHMAEELIEKQLAQIPHAVFRPAAVYGPGDKEMSPLFRITRAGILPMVGGRSMRFGLLHVDDLVAAITCWLSAETAVQGVYEIDDGRPGGYDAQSVAAIAQDVWQRRVHCVFFPAPFLSLMASVNLWSARMLHYSPMLTPGKVRELRHPDWVSDIAPLTRALPDWQPSIRLQDALAQAI